MPKTSRMGQTVSAPGTANHRLAAPATYRTENILIHIRCRPDASAIAPRTGALIAMTKPASPIVSPKTDCAATGSSITALAK